MNAIAATEPNLSGQEVGFRPARLTDAFTLRLQPTLEFDAVRLLPASRLDAEQLFDFCRENEKLRIEQTAEGELIIMAPVGSEGSSRNFNLYIPFAAWQEQGGGGVCFDATAGFTLPNGAMRSPDFAWVRQERIDALTKQQYAKFAPLCPDFVVELRSRTERLPVLQEKMAEYVANGARLGWLIDPLERQVFVYRPEQPVEHLHDPASLSGEPVLTGFTLDLARVW